MNLFIKCPFVWEKIVDWSKRDEVFVKRVAFTLIACLCVHDKTAEDQRFIDLFPLIKRESVDGRNFVKKAVNWALRNIGKRNLALNSAAIKVAYSLRELDSNASRWVGSDAVKELESEAVQKRLAANF